MILNFKHDLIYVQIKFKIQLILIQIKFRSQKKIQNIFWLQEDSILFLMFVGQVTVFTLDNYEVYLILILAPKTK